jgi:thiol-disulfide isomerase/thioredoxin
MKHMHLRGKSLLLLIVMSLCSLPGFSQDMAPYEKFSENVKSHTGLSYDVYFRDKQFGRQDTFITNAHVDLAKIPGDELFGGEVLITMDTSWVGYNGDNILMGDKNFNELLFVDPSANPNALIKTTSMNELIIHRFLNFSDLLAQIRNDPSFKVFIVDTIIDKISCLGIRIHIPENEGMKNEKLLLTFDKRTGFYHRNVHSVEFQNDNQYREWVFSNPSFNYKKELEALTAQSIAKYKQTIKYDPISKARSILPNLAAIEGKILNEKKFASIAKDTSKYILLDFWYSSCHPCIKSIPVINQLKIAYGEKGVSFYGINPIDNEEANKHRLANFLISNPMMYPTIMPNAPIDDKVTIKAYPTVIILDKYRNIVFQETGFSPELHARVVAALDKLVK